MRKLCFHGSFPFIKNQSNYRSKRTQNWTVFFVIHIEFILNSINWFIEYFTLISEQILSFASDFRHFRFVATFYSKRYFVSWFGSFFCYAGTLLIFNFCVNVQETQEFLVQFCWVQTVIEGLTAWFYFWKQNSNPLNIADEMIENDWKNHFFLNSNMSMLTQFNNQFYFIN